MDANLTAAQERAQDQSFVQSCSWAALEAKLPLRWPAPADIPPSPKTGYRSHYVYPGLDDLFELKNWEHLDDFDLLLRLINFDPLRPVLAQRLGWTSAQGQVPFDPVSLFLLIGWQMTQKWTRTKVLEEVRKPKNTPYAEIFGFEEGIFPSEGGLRYFLTTLGQHSQVEGAVIQLTGSDGQTQDVAIQFLNQLISQSVWLIKEAGIISPEVWEQATVCPDGMIHDAASRMRCSSVQETCYQPTSADEPRPCPAKEKDKRGCECETFKCAQICRFTTPRDVDARAIYYSGSNQSSNNPNRATDPKKGGKSRGKMRYGYRSLPLELIDPERRFNITLLSHFQGANAIEAPPVAALIQQCQSFYPSLNIDLLAGDANFGFDIVLSTLYQQRIKRVIDLRRHQSDRDKLGWITRGYDDQGRPVCPFGYRLTANGFDTQRHRRKWCCNQCCLKDAQPVIEVESLSYPPPECPYNNPDNVHGQIINVGKTFADGSNRLVRDIPFDSPAWKRAYQRPRSAVEGRNSALKRWGLKHLSVFGFFRSKATVFLADTYNNLTTLTRLIREATQAAQSA